MLGLIQEFLPILTGIVISFACGYAFAIGYRADATPPTENKTSGASPIAMRQFGAEMAVDGRMPCLL
jgi:hypothetical protein